MLARFANQRHARIAWCQVQAMAISYRGTAGKVVMVTT